MSCPHTSLTYDEKPEEVEAAFQGILSHLSLELFRPLVDLVRSSAPRDIRLDLSAAERVDETGFGPLIALQRVASDTGKTFEIIAPTQEDAELLERAGLSRVIFSDA